jgi:hypothetical protein
VSSQGRNFPTFCAGAPAIVGEMYSRPVRFILLSSWKEDHPKDENENRGEEHARFAIGTPLV